MGSEIFRTPESVNWLLNRNIHIKYYDGSLPDANEILERTLKTRHLVNVTKVTGLGTAAIGAGLFLLGAIEAIPCLLGCGANPRYERRIEVGFNLTIVGGAVFMIGRLSSKGGIKKSLRRFTEIVV